jgi:hypothetical protein
MNFSYEKALKTKEILIQQLRVINYRNHEFQVMIVSDTGTAQSIADVIEFGELIHRNKEEGLTLVIIDGIVNRGGVSGYVWLKDANRLIGSDIINKLI